jgi:aryl-alcohol dehydrogenase-like predicted oxidoreductase
LSRLILGTVQFGMSYGIANHTGKVSNNQSRGMLNLCRDNNIGMIDTAIAYGESEKCLGELGVNSFKIVTKLPSVPYNCKDVSIWVEDQFNESLLRLGVNSVYGLLLHRSEQLLEKNGQAIYKAMQSLKESGKVEKVGISIYSPNELDKIFHLYDLDLIQSPFNLIDQRLFKTGWMDRLHNKNIEIHTRSVFLQGLLLMAQADIPIKFSQWSSIWTKWYKWLNENDILAVDACLAYPMSFSQINRVVVGADNISQLKQIIKAVSIKSPIKFPNLENGDEALINPSNWSKL